jgi:hypothetical protein
MGRDNDLESALGSLLAQVASGVGVTHESVARCSNAITRASARWSEAGTMSSREAAALIAYYPSIEAASSRYPEAVRKEIVATVARLNREIVQALAGRSPGDIPEH